MCGIFGYVGKEFNKVSTVLNGIKTLEYRGYDSAGIAGIKNGKIYSSKVAGKISKLEEKVNKENLDLDIAIAHTRWATHGKPTEENAHPHFDQNKSLALVHNGIIENFDILKKKLLKQGVKFVSETDTEVIAHLISSHYDGDILKAVQKTIPLLKGSYAIALIHQDYPDLIVAIAHESPLVIGIGKNQAFVSSDSNAFVEHTREVVFLSNSEIALIRPDKLEIYNAEMEQLNKERTTINHNGFQINKEGYEHYTLKEIHEQPQVIRNALLSRFYEDYGTAVFQEIKFDVKELLNVERILVIACGTSWHAGFVASYMIEDMARIPVQVEISSEFRYKNPIVPTRSLVIAISQSGETADTIAAVRELKAKGARILSITNVDGSSLAREADANILLHAGVEIGVCSTKAYTSQVTVLALFSLMMARMRHMGKQEGQVFLEALKKLPEQVQKVLNHEQEIHKIAKKYANYDNFFYLGRRYMYPTSLEGALKLKEISYINANGYPAGEMKHGPIALINEKCPTVALCANKMTYEKLFSNLMEVKARSGPVIAIAEEGSDRIEEIADEVIWVPQTIDEVASIPSTVATQLLAYYIAYERGTEIDQPRNLAKSVTVE